MLDKTKPYATIAGRFEIPGVRFEQGGRYFMANGQPVGGEPEPEKPAKRRGKAKSAPKPVEPVEPEEEALADLPRHELAAKAHALGMKVTATMSNADVIAMIEGTK